MGEAFKKFFRFLRDHPAGIIGALGVILGIILMVQNGHSVESHFLFWTIDMPMVVWAIFFMIIGYLGGRGAQWCWNRRKRLK